MMKKVLLDKLVAFRRELHQYPEVSFKEFETHKRLKNMLLSFGVPENSIREINKEGQDPTGLIVDLPGKGHPSGKPRCVAFRADIDALQMKELNTNLEYVSKNEGAAHMCGHDGHMTCLIGFVALFMNELQTFPSDRTLRLLFQPSQEGPIPGAELMIEKGCLEGVDQVYGFHNWPVGTFGHVWCKEGAVMSQITIMKIVITGTGGHGSEPQILKVAIWKAVEFYTQIQQFIMKLKAEKRNFACTFPVLQAGERYNVISERALIEGTIRSYDEETRELILAKVGQLLSAIEKEGFKVQFEKISFCKNENTKKEAEHVLQAARELFGNECAGEGLLPFKASEDFGYYTQKCPGAFFFFCTKEKEDEVFLHNAHFDFKDNLIERASLLWLKLAQKRLLGE